MTIGNSLDGGGSDVAGGGDLPTGGAGGGQAGPSTQQSNDNIGGGCVRSFHVKLKVLHNGSEEACTVATTLMFGGGDVIANNGGGVYAPVDEEADGPPKVTVSPAGAMPATQSLSCVEGRWQTTDPFFFRAVCTAGHDVTANANWRHNGQTHLSNTYSGAPTKEPGDYTPIPLELTIDLGNDSHLYQYDSENSVNAVY